MEIFTILLGTHNRDKVREIREIMASMPSVRILSADDVPNVPDVVEDGDTIESNAVKKATEIAKTTGYLTLSDDTGLFVDALDGAPGVMAARFAGEGCSYRDNRLKMLDSMKNKEDRAARFQTVVALAGPDGLVGTARGSVEGRITDEERGENGFGYDAVFEAVETGRTFGEMSESDKHDISHRGRAFRNILPLIKELIQQ